MKPSAIAIAVIVAFSLPAHAESQPASAVRDWTEFRDWLEGLPNADLRAGAVSWIVNRPAALRARNIDDTIECSEMSESYHRGDSRDFYIGCSEAKVRFDRIDAKVHNNVQYREAFTTEYGAWIAGEILSKYVPKAK
jgi:hypothetical protein